jgi:acyl-CoA thioesterase-1
MLSMVAGYGPRAAKRKAAFAKACAVFIFALAFALPGLAQARPIRLLILGDSLTAGYGLAAPDTFQTRLAAALHKAGYDVTLVDGAVSGDTTAGGLARLDWTIGDGAIVALGGNDGLRGIDPKDTLANLTAILNDLRARHVKVLLSGMYAPPNLGPQYEQGFRAVFDALGRRPGILYDPFLLQGVAANPALNQADHLHPNPAGVNIEIARLLPLVEKLLDEVPKR